MTVQRESLKVGIQGVLASFHDVAARKYFFGADIIPFECISFKKLCETLANHETDFGVMAIENTIAGSILTNYSLMERYQFKIMGEIYHRIELSLMALPGQKIEDLKFVQSHPMALHQSEEFLFKHSHLKILEAADTAESAKWIGAQKLKGYGAIAAAVAAKQYGLEILKEGIETNKQNYTRFIVISRHEDYETSPDANKASVRFETADSPGSLVTILEIFKVHGINMTKIQSVPILGKPYQYSIHLDLEWSDKEAYHRALEDFKREAENIFHFGEYKKGERPLL